MELTRNFYRLEEVRASLTYSLVHGRMKEAVFWAEELKASDCGPELAEVLFHTWIFWACPHDCGILAEIRRLECDDSDVDLEVGTILWRLREAIEAAKGSANVLSLLVRGLRPHPAGYWTRWPTTRDSEIAMRREAATGVDQQMCHVIAEAVRRGNAARAWFFVAREEHGAMCQLLPRLVRGGGDSGRKRELRAAVRCLVGFSKTATYHRHPALAAACILLSARSNVRPIILRVLRPDATHVRNSVKAVDSWVKTQGHRGGRIFDIPKEAIYGNTTRGTSTADFSTLEELHDIEPVLKQSTPFWKWILANYNMVDADDRETFYDTWFPDDIPDEWSLADKNKSHGDCLLPTGSEKADWSIYLSNYFRPFLSSVWSRWFRYLMGSEETDAPLDFSRLYEKHVRKVEPLWLLEKKGDILEL